MSHSRFEVVSAAVLFMLNVVVPVRAVTVLNETFDNDSAFTKADVDSAAVFFRDEEDDNEYWGINDPTGNTDDYDGAPPPATADVPPYTLFSGNFLNGEDLDANEDIEPLILDWSNLDISGLVDISFSGLFAANGDFEAGVDDAGDFIRVQYRIDSDFDAFANLLWFSPQAMTLSTDPLRVDDDFDGTGTGDALSLAAQTFSAPIGLTGLTLDVRILMGSDGREELALDSLNVTGMADIPTDSGDYNFDGTVDAADYVVWRKTNGEQAGYNTWLTTFGEPGGSGSGASVNTTVPEPGTLILFIFATAGWCRLQRRAA